MEPGMRLREAVRELGDRREATVIGGRERRFKTSARSAAMANSFLSQILEWEDWTFLTHSGAAIVPVVLAAGELGRASGRDVLAAIVAGNEILARAGEFLTDVIHTGNAQAAHQLELPLLAAKLLGLDAERMRDASGIACTQPQVTSIASWTADAKGMLTGAPAYTALLAAQLAKKGLSGRRDLLENPLGYFYSVSDVGSPRRLERAVKDLGADWRFARQYFNKRYPTDGFQLPAVHAMLDVRRQIFDAHPTLDPADLPAEIERVFARIPLVMAASATMFGKGKVDLLDRVLDPNRPDWTYIALLFDGPYPLLAALLDGELTQRQYRGPVIQLVRDSGLYERIEMVPDLSMGVFGAEITVTFRGQEYKSFVSCIRNERDNGFLDVNEDSVDPTDPMEIFTADDKFHLTAAEALPSFGDRQAILDAIDGLESFTDINAFTAIL
ncbi:MAG: MmgE/PrpD family protein, partial [Candidatus Binatia bacterium]